MTTQIDTKSAEETLALGAWIGRRLPAGAIVGLDGPLAAGKTWMAKGIVRGIGAHDVAWVKSPAYNLMHEYHVGEPQRSVFHIDFYRLDELTLSDAMLFGESLERPDTICIVEWASKFLPDLTPGFLSVTLARCDAPERRTIRIKSVGPHARYASLLRELSQYANATP